MEGWLYGLFALVGVLAGGLFTYLGMKKQLEQQSKLDSRHWKREVRGKPLLKLRDELARMATKLNMLVLVTQVHDKGEGWEGIEEERQNKELQLAADEWKDYGTSRDFLQAFYLQYDEELLKLVENIRSHYLFLFEYALDWKSLKTDEFRSFRELFEKVKSEIHEVQELINKRLEEL